MRYLRGIIYSWLIVSAPLLGMTGFADNAFLCWGSGGHICIETQACETSCQTPAFYSSSKEHLDYDEHSDSCVCTDGSECGACIDIPLPSGGATVRPVRSGGWFTPQNALLCAAPQADPIITGDLYWLTPSNGGGDGTIASLRTVVLLI